MRRVSLLVIFIVVFTTLAVPSLRELAGLQIERLWSTNKYRGFLRLSFDAPQEYSGLWLDQATPHDEQKAIAYAEQHYREDSELLVAASSFIKQRSGNYVWFCPKYQDLQLRAISMLKRAAILGDTPAAWSAYTAVLWEQSHLDLYRVVSADPTDSQSMEKARREIQQELDEEIKAGRPTGPTTKQAKELFDALRQWQRADSQNAVPVAMEALALYCLNRDREALQRLKSASDLPLVTTRSKEQGYILRRLLRKVGVPPLEAASTALWTSGSMLWTSQLRDIARVGFFEGMRSSMESRPQDAVELWDAVTNLGQNLETSSRDLIEFLMGCAIIGIGTSPNWKWYHDKASGIPNGPLLKGRIFYGRYHELYTKQRSEGESLHQRDALIIAKLHSGLISKYLNKKSELILDFINLSNYITLVSQLMLLQIGITALLLLATFLLAWKRPILPKNQASGSRLTTIGLTLVAVTIIWTVLGGLYLSDKRILPGFPLGFLVFPATVALFMSFRFTLRNRMIYGGLRATWASSLRQIMLPLIALLAISYLCTANIAVTMRTSLTRHLEHKFETSEMDEIKKWAGDKWTNPVIPADSWRAQYLPENAPIFRSKGK